MIEEMYLKEYHDEGDTLVISFEGNREDIYRLRDYANVINRDIDSDTEKDMVSHPSHYNREGALETIWEMVALYGIDDVKSFCRLNAHKYRSRAMDKGGEEDMKKSDFYIKFCAYLETTPEGVVYKHLKERCDNFRDIKKSNNK